MPESFHLISEIQSSQDRFGAMNWLDELNKLKLMKLINPASVNEL